MKGLEKLVAPFSVEEFYNEFYEKRWHHFDQKKPEYEGFFDFDDLEEYLFVARPWATKSNELRCVKYPGTSFEPEISSFEELLELYADGHTIVLNSVHKRWPVIAKVCSELSNQFFCRVNANIYVTPPGNKGFEAHYDTHDVIILQTEGSKEWFLSEHERLQITHINDDLRNEFYEIDAEKDTKNSVSIQLDAGQCLYVPRGTIHSAEANNSLPSIHITFSIFPVTWASLMRAVILDGSLKDTELMKTVPFEVLEDLSSATAHAKINEMLKKAISLADFESTWRFLYERDISLQPGGGIDSILRLKNLNTQSLVKIRGGAEIFVDVHKDKCWVSFSGRRLRAPLQSLDYLYYISENYTFTVDELPDVHGDKKSKLAFVEWLIRKGWLHFAEK
ncbi:cupin domain-containing protein [Pseudoalteromonas piscicida]|uniref:JmjC domain-containing protein n=1 Tax=Pseudoalteromonas piscicida TaxID=43662 RepID=A0ABM6NMN9_PSEO7|nr:cupin domain-containing protein [Pseudoalteromonas piscicida]ATD10238.1 hypothetical protein PPIS_b1232 [Pseudoalteromonas piscicida]WPU32079.1 cupin domain-containing protein [Pseudoalteromonas piscicida]